LLLKAVIKYKIPIKSGIIISNINSFSIISVARSPVDIDIISSMPALCVRIVVVGFKNHV
jgi:hypothetical protein